ncbi:hypothetical protein AB0K00_26905 [Dactylosporangium sp. NPDC049525]|uniref:hypothetical protein n=1 Tax=Dactylosporangium sp. NPDC049525 TaxID=3154730 RepID=UPI00344435CC
MSGADADELQRLGLRMQEAANRLEGIRSEVSAAFARTAWDGEDGQHFRDLWQHRLSGLLLQAAGSTRAASVVAVRNAQEQRIASGADGTGGGGGSFPPSCTLSGPVDQNGGFLKVLGDLNTVVIGGIATVLGQLDAKKFGKVAKAVGGVGDVVGGAIDVYTLVNAIQHGNRTGNWDSTKVATADVVADVAFPLLELATIGFPPAAIGIFVADVGWNLLVPDDAKLAAVNGVIDAGHHLYDAGGHVVSAVADVGRAVGDVGGAVVDIAEGGFNNAKKLLGW